MGEEKTKNKKPGTITFNKEERLEPKLQCEVKKLIILPFIFLSGSFNSGLFLQCMEIHMCFSALFCSGSESELLGLLFGGRRGGDGGVKGGVFPKAGHY